MEQKKFKIIIGFIYTIILISFLYFLLSSISISDISSYNFIQSYQDRLVLFKSKNIFTLIIIFILFVNFWVLLLGFGTPVAIIGGFIFGKWAGTLLTALSLSSGSLILYFLGKYFFYEFLKKKYYKKFNYLNSIFKNNELPVMIIFRFVGLVPFFIANLIPVIFNIKPINYFVGTLIGILPSVFVFVSLGNGFSEAIYQYENYPSFVNLIKMPEIYLPIFGFILIILISFILRKKFFKINEQN
tara:strand:- start:623 stop:1351 length:729 start_codon:yes stop_codon:yes gene_type:complete